MATLPYRLPPMARHRRTGRASRIPWYSCGPWSARLSPARASAPDGAPLGRRVGDAGRSDGHPGLGWSGVAPAPPPSMRQRADCPGGSCSTRDFGQPTSGAPAAARSGHTGGCGLPQHRGLAGHPGAAGSPPGASAPSASRAGDPGRARGPGARPATSAVPRMLRQDAGGPTGDGQPRQTAPWGGWRPLGDAGAQRPGGAPPLSTWVASPPGVPGV